MNGTYECLAVSSHGNVTRDVFLTVLCEYPRIWGWVRGGLGAKSSALHWLPCLYHTDTDYHQNKLAIIIIVLTVLAIAGLGAGAFYHYNRQRKIRIYRLQKAQEEAMNLKAQASPP